jgi:uncharacterized OsmC-like protein
MKTLSDIKDALDRASALVKSKPSIGQRTYKSSAVIEEGLSCVVSEKNWRIEADTPEAMGGENAAPSPNVLFRASVSSCVAIGVRMWAARLEAPVARVEVHFETDVDARGQFGVCDDTPAGFECARLAVHVVSDAPAEAVRKAIETSLRYSSMLDALSSDIPVDVEINIVQSVYETKGSVA